jgi:hypothetical protein
VIVLHLYTSVTDSTLQQSKIIKDKSRVKTIKDKSRVKICAMY